MGFRHRQLGAALAAVSLVAAPISATAVPLPTSPTDASISNQWVNPAIRTADARSEVDASIDSISDAEVQLTIHNNSGAMLSDVSVRVQRANPVTSVSAGRSTLAAEESAFDIAAPFLPVPVDLAPGETHNITIPLDHATLQLTKEGIYPLLVNVNGELGGGGQQYLTSERTLLQIGLPKPAERPTPITMLLPVTAQTDILPGETGEAPGQPPLVLQSERLAGDIAPGGRLTALLDVQRSEPQSTCLAVDPELALTVSRMASGYQVANERPDPVAHKPRLRDSWGNKDQHINSQAGTGSDDARAWMKQLAEIAGSGGCVVAMPWANAELGAVAATGNESLLEQATLAGPRLLTSLLGVPVRGDVIVPDYGYLEQRTVTGLDSILSSPTVALVADETLPGHAVPVGEHLTALGFNSDLAAQLATLGDTPDTAGYANQWQRYDYRLDSPAARRAAASASLTLAATDDAKPLLVVPPSDLSAEDAHALQHQLRTLLNSGIATPQALGAYLSVGHDAPGTTTGTAFEDPTVVTDTEIVRAVQQAKSIDDLTSLMIEEPTIALTPTGFTQPLRRDLLRGLTASGRRSISSYDAHAKDTDTLLNANRDVLQRLRSSVVLLPPGNVYTRTSESSPLLIIAENGLPLPVDARISYTGPEDAIISVADSLKIPARGSITTQMMADLPDTKGRTDLTVWLASQNGAPISYPVDISVQTRSGLLGAGGLVALVLAGLGFVMFHVKRR
ncbi:hypothetical protein [Corynebacterium sp. H130]|uniref:hypothetical protein n=1 Tax=Corynebacterium sp. H130 TaxID=3133444 RepID=UPI003095DE26